jgi:hypothetical protein
MFANWRLWVLNGSIPLKDAIQYAQKNFTPSEEMLLVIFQRWSVAVNEISKYIGELILKIFPREILEKMTTFDLEHFCHTSVLDFIFELPFFSQEFYHSLMWHCGSRLKDKYVNDKYTQSLIYIIEHKSHIVDVNIKNPYRDSLLTYAMWRGKPKLFECLVNHDIIVDNYHERSYG